MLGSCRIHLPIGLPNSLGSTKRVAFSCDHCFNFYKNLESLVLFKIIPYCHVCYRPHGFGGLRTNILLVFHHRGDWK